MITTSIYYLKPEVMRTDLIRWASQGYFVGKENYDKVTTVTSDDYPDNYVCGQMWKELNVDDGMQTRLNLRSMMVGDVIVIDRNDQPLRCYIVAPAGFKRFHNPGTKGTCTRCGGYGYIPSYPHVQGGVCFKCGGSGRAT